MADVTLSDGREISIDLTKVTVKEFRALIDPAQPKADEDATVAKSIGMTADELTDLPWPDYLRITQAFTAHLANPLADPS